MHLGSGTFCIQLILSSGCSQQSWHPLSLAGKGRHTEAVAMGARDITSFKRPKERGKEKSKPETSKQHLTHLTSPLFPFISKHCP